MFGLSHIYQAEYWRCLIAAISQNRAPALTLEYESTTHTEADLGIAHDTNTDPDSLSCNKQWIRTVFNKEVYE